MAQAPSRCLSNPPRATRRREHGLTRRVTISVTTFDRPAHLERCLASIQELHGNVKTIVADNGRLPAPRSRSEVSYLDLPFDVGLAASRNAIVDALATEYLLVMEDDMACTRQTTIERLVEILDERPEIGCVAGALDEGDPKRESHPLLDFSISDGQLRLSRSRDTSQYRLACGASYRLGHMVPNFFLARREFLADHRWDAAYKLWEHVPYFWEVHRAGGWLVAQCDAVRVFHDLSGRTREYDAMRWRSRQYRKLFLERTGFRGLTVDRSPIAT